MVDFLPGDLFVGGDAGYVVHYHKIFTVGEWAAQYETHIPANDDEGNPMRVMGMTVRPEPFAEPAQLFTALCGSSRTDFDPHDICWLPDDSGLLVIILRFDNSVELVKYDYDGSVLGIWTGLETDVGYDGAPLKIDVTCDSKTVFYTDRGRTIFRYDISTLAGAQLPPYAIWPVGATYLHNAFKLVKLGKATVKVVVNTTTSGIGPRSAVSLDSDLLAFWCDEINRPDEKRVYLRSLVTNGSQITRFNVSLHPDDSSIGSEVLSLACNMNPCLIKGTGGYVMIIRN